MSTDLDDTVLHEMTRTRVEESMDRRVHGLGKLARLPEAGGGTQ